MDESGISFKATVNGLILVLRDDVDFETLLLYVEKKLETSGKFFKGASVDVRYRGRKLSSAEEESISSLLSSRTGAQIISFEEEQGHQERIEAVEPEKQTERLKMRMLYFKGIEEGVSKFHRGTVRSGQLVSFDGNLVVIGDVNPGGQVEATGNVIVMGSLRGIVHAGADGNKEAVVAALNLQPTQLRIADVITRPPDADLKENRAQYIPELAAVKGDTVYIERFLPQFK